MRIAGAWVAVLVVAASAQAQVSQNEPTCRALRHGEALITKVEFADGYTVEGPWHVVAQTQKGRTTAITVVLHQIIETEPLSGKRQTTALPDAVEMTFQGTTPADLLDTAAHIWCATVMRARPPDQALPVGAGVVPQNRTM
jgi:hypothetical protein